MRRLLGTAWHPDVVATFCDVIAEARRRHGPAGAALVGLVELADLIRSGLRARFGRRLPITSGWRPRPPHQQGRFPMHGFMRDLRLAVRTLAAARVATSIAITTLALGIGVSTAIYSVLDSILLRPMPFQESRRLVEVWTLNTQSQFSFPRSSRALMLEWRRQTDLFDRVEAYEIESAIHMGPEGAEMVSASFVTPGLMPLLGVAPAEGRVLSEGDGRDGTDDRVVISARFWRDRLGSDPAAVGRRLTLHGRPHEIVGIMPASFHFPNHGQELWLPLDLEHLPAHRMHGAVSVTVLARLRDDVPLRHAAAQVASRGADVIAAAGGRPGLTGKLHPKGESVDRRTRQSLEVMAGAVGFLLLIVCANLANFSLSRALSRGRDMAVRASLGASRGDLIRETLIENLVIGVVGAGLGIFVAWVTLAAGSSAIPVQLTFSTVNAIDLDGRVLAFAVSLGLVMPVLFGLPPALLASRPNVIAALRQDTRTSAGSPASTRLRGALVIGEVMVALVLLAGAGLMARSLYNLQSIDRGFDTGGLIALQLGLPAAGFLDPYARDLFTEDLITRLRQTPGVTDASAGGVPPDASMVTWGRVEFAHNPGGTTPNEVTFPVYRVWPGYFEAIGLRLLEGRDFIASDTSADVIISTAFARDHWPGRSAVGGRFRFTGSKTWKTVVGVAADVRQFDLDDANGAYEWFAPLRTPPGRTTPAAPEATTAIIDYRTMLVRADNAAAVIPALTKAVHAQDPRVVIWKTSLVDDLFAEAIERPRAVFAVLVAFGTLGLVLAAAGIYGVMSHMVTQRLRELGIRLALGARPLAVFGLVLRNGLGLTLVGLVLGLLAAVSIARVMRALLYEVDALDPVALVSVSALLALAAVAACWRPARRAMRVDPISLLREP